MSDDRHVLDSGRVLADLQELRRRTEDADGAQRVAFSPTWGNARELLVEQLEPLGVAIEVDEIGNLWATLPGRVPDAVVIGGHLDSVPNGGWLDGALNVFAGVEILRRLAGEADRPVTVRLVDWADEEGARFGGWSTFGSAVATGVFDPVALADLTDPDGVSLASAAADFGIDVRAGAAARRQLDDVAAYVELHIEQGPVLESLDLALAAVTGTIGVRRHMVRFTGQAAHAGATLMATRRDALLAAARTALRTRAVAVESGGFGTCGHVKLVPGVATAVPGWCELSVDLRHEDQGVLDEMVERLREQVALIGAEERVGVEWHPTFQAPATAFAPALVDIARAVVAERTGSEHTMPSATLHDATRTAGYGIPTAMLFVQSVGGISHTKEEDTDPVDLEAAVQAFDEIVERTISWLATRVHDGATGR